jgi:chaperonin GroEL
LPDGEKAGGWCLLRALQAPLHKIASNAYKKADGIIDRLLNDMQDMGTFDWTGWDAKTATCRDFRQEPMIVDPVFVVTSALQAAVSVATTLLTAEASITPLVKK